MKIASLIPSGTDIACDLGLADHLVGVSHCCDHPAARGLPVLTRSVVPAGLSPGEIDTTVSNALAAGESLYQTNRELLRELKPDVVLTQSICDVCAVNAQTAAASLPAGARLVNLGATSLDGLWADLRAVAQATNADAENLISQLQTRLQTLSPTPTQPRILVLEWSDPPFLGGHWVPELVEIAGGQHVLSAPGEPSRRSDWPEIAAAKPEVIVLAPCGYNLEETVTQGQELLQNPDFLLLGAREVWATNATALFSRCTPASVRGAEVLSAILNAKTPPETEALRIL